jgi:hypothetical protein
VIDSVSANITSYTDSGFKTINTTYYYRVRAKNYNIYSAYSNTASIKTPGSLLAPNILSAIPVSASQITLTWQNRRTTETGIRIEYSLSPQGPYSLASSVNPDVTTYTHSGLSEGTTYYYRLSTFKDNDTSPYANIYATTLLPLPNLQVISTTSSSVILGWQDNSNNETGFKIERSTNSLGPFTQIGAVTANVVTYTDAGLPEGSRYYYRVLAYNSQANSSPSNVISAATQLPAPSNLTVTAVSANQITLSWQDNSSNEISFIIECSVNGGVFTQAGTVGANVTTFKHAGLTAGTTYKYRAKAFITRYSTSSYSNVVSAVASGQ